MIPFWIGVILVVLAYMYRKGKIDGRILGWYGTMYLFVFIALLASTESCYSCEDVWLKKAIIAQFVMIGFGLWAIIICPRKKAK